MFGLITGSGFYDIPELEGRSVESIETPFGGPVAVTTGRWGGADVCFLPRHGADHSIPPHAINYRANVWALKAAGAEDVLATAVSGGIRPGLEPGTLVLISDYLNFTSGRSDTFFDGTPAAASLADDATRIGGGGVVHTDMSDPYSSELRAVVRRAAGRESIDLVDGGVYCTTNGPRFETPAEIRMMATAGGDLVGMTGYPEVALAVEAGLRYASIGVISNVAAGLGAEKLSVEDIVELIGSVGEPLYRLIGATVELAGAAGNEGERP